jgi:hypothetical protein
MMANSSFLNNAKHVIPQQENDQGDHRPATMGNTTVAQRVYQKLLYVPIPPRHYN